MLKLAELVEEDYLRKYLPIPEAVAQSCSLKKVFLEISQDS